MKSGPLGKQLTNRKSVLKLAVATIDSIGYSLNFWIIKCILVNQYDFLFRVISKAGVYEFIGYTLALSFFILN